MDQIMEIFTKIQGHALWNFFKVLVLSLLAYGFLRILTRLIIRFVFKKSSQQIKMLIHKVLLYSGTIVILIVALSAWGLNLSALLGAAGVIGIAIGIASQKSLGNIISGVFLISENTFEIGDVIRVGDKVGIVFSIDLLSVRIRTFDNLLVRIPNENLISTDVTNITRFPIRRMDFLITVDYKEDLLQVEQILKTTANLNPLCLDEPEPFFILRDFGSSGIELTFGVWFEKPNYMAVKNSLFNEIKKAFEAEGISIPYPHIKVVQ